jgi:hypothetical protein
LSEQLVASIANCKYDQLSEWLTGSIGICKNCCRQNNG